MSRDITTRKHAELKLQIEERRLAALIDNAMDAIVTWTRSQCVILFNTAAEKIFGCSAAEVLGKPLDRFLPERLRDSTVTIYKCSRPGPHRPLMQPRGTLYGLRANGQEFPLEATISQVTVAGQKLFTVILRDVTERKHAEALEGLYAQTKEMDRVKTEFFANISHDLRTPLTLILNPLEDLLRNPGTSIAVPRADLELMCRNSLRLLSMVNTLLDLSRIDAGSWRRSFNLAISRPSTAENATIFRSIVESAGLYLNIDIDDLDEPVYVDRAMWDRVVLNLLSNAFKFTLKGGITVSLKRNGGVAELSVSDSGIGIPESELPRIFDRFHRVKGSRGRSFEGTGIGLALVHELVNLHGGSIEVHSQIDHGTTFTVSIPFGTAHLPAGRGCHRPRDSRSSDGRVIWKKCNPPQYSNHARCLTPRRPPPESFWPTTMPTCAPTSHASWRRPMKWKPSETARKRMAAALRKCPDLVLTDVMMPRMNGLRLLQELRKNPATSTVPVIMLSARAGDEPLLMGLETGADDYVIKPFSAEQLLARVRSHVALARLREEAKSSVKQSEARFRQLLEVAPEAILEVGEEGRILLVNQAAEQMFGYHRDEFLTLHVDALVPEAQRENHALSDSIYEEPNRRPMGSGLPLNARRKDGSLFPVEISLSPIHSSGTVRVIAVVRDITDRRKAEANLRPTVRS